MRVVASRYHWLTGGIDQQFNSALPNTQISAAALPPGAQMKRFLIRNCHFQAKNVGASQSSQFALAMAWTVQFTGGANTGRIIWQANRDIPLQTWINSGAISGVFGALWHAGDNELGVNQRAIYGKATDGGANLQFTFGVTPDRFHDFTNLFGEWSWNYGILYYL